MSRWDHRCETAGDFEGAGTTPSAMIALLQQDPDADDPTARGDGGFFVEKRTRVTATGGVVRLVHRGAAREWPTVECENRDRVVVIVDDA